MKTILYINNNIKLDNIKFLSKFLEKGSIYEINNLDVLNNLNINEYNLLLFFCSSENDLNYIYNHNSISIKYVLFNLTNNKILIKNLKNKPVIISSSILDMSYEVEIKFIPDFFWNIPIVNPLEFNNFISEFRNKNSNFQERKYILSYENPLDNSLLSIFMNNIKNYVTDFKHENKVNKLDDNKFHKFWEFSNFIERLSYFKQFKYCIVSEPNKKNQGAILNKIFEVYIAGSIPVVYDPLDICASYFNPKCYVKLDEEVRYEPVKKIISALNEKEISSYYNEPLLQYIPDIYSIFGENVCQFWNTIKNL